MSWIQVIGAAFQIVLWILNAIKEKNDDKRKNQTEEIQSIARGVIDRDESRVNSGFDRLRRLRKS